MKPISVSFSFLPLRSLDCCVLKMPFTLLYSVINFLKCEYCTQIEETQI